MVVCCKQPVVHDLQHFAVASSSPDTMQTQTLGDGIINGLLQSSCSVEVECSQTCRWSVHRHVVGSVERRSRHKGWMQGTPYATANVAVCVTASESTVTLPCGQGWCVFLCARVGLTLCEPVCPAPIVVCWCAVHACPFCAATALRLAVVTGQWASPLSLATYMLQAFQGAAGGALWVGGCIGHRVFVGFCLRVVCHS